MNYQSTTNAPVFQGHAINTGSDGQYACYEIMLYRIRKHMELMTDRHNKVLFIRCDLRFPQDYSSDNSNDQVSHLFKIIKEHYTNKGIDLQFMWFREQSRLKHQHYHCVILIDGNKIQSYYPVLEYVSNVWARLLQSDTAGLVDYCNWDRDGNPAENGIIIKRASSKAEGMDLLNQEQMFRMNFEKCHHWASYLAKVNQKANIPEGPRRFGVSQIKPTKVKGGN